MPCDVAVSLASEHLQIFLWVDRRLEVRWAAVLCINHHPQQVVVWVRVSAEVCSTRTPAAEAAHGQLPQVPGLRLWVRQHMTRVLHQHMEAAGTPVVLAAVLLVAILLHPLLRNLVADDAMACARVKRPAWPSAIELIITLPMPMLVVLTKTVEMGLPTAAQLECFNHLVEAPKFALDRLVELAHHLELQVHNNLLFFWVY